MTKKIFILLFFLLLFINPANSGDLKGMVEALGKAKSAGVSIDLDATSKEYGYKNFKGFVKAYKKRHQIKYLPVEDAKTYFNDLGMPYEIEDANEQRTLYNYDALNRLSTVQKIGETEPKLESNLFKKVKNSPCSLSSN